MSDQNRSKLLCSFSKFIVFLHSSYHKEWITRAQEYMYAILTDNIEAIRGYKGIYMYVCYTD